MQKLSAQIEFDSEFHRYTRAGFVVPSVTQILSMLTDFSGIRPEVLEYKRNLGTQVHAATALDDKDDLGFFDLAIDPYIKAWRKFKTDTDFVAISIEEIVYHKKWNYAGTLDRIGTIKGKEVLLDVKTGPINLMVHGPQTAAYADACGFKGKRMIAQLLADGTYRVQECYNKMDMQAFLYCRNLRLWKEFYGR